MLSLAMGGGEINAFGELLEATGVDTITVSYMGLRRRIKHLNRVNLADRFKPSTKILLDSGCHSLNNAPDKLYSDDELKEIAGEYDEFVKRHRERLDCYVEFDALQLGQEWIRERRTGDAKEIVVWRDEDGVEELRSLCSNYPRVGVTGTSLGDRDLTPLLVSAVPEHGVQLYGLGMSKPEQMAEIPWTAVTSTSWLSPSKFRDVIVWTGSELKRYPKKNRDAGKRRHRTYLRDMGFDTDLIEGDDTQELLRLAIWSWLCQVAAINKTDPPKIATKAGNGQVECSAQTADEIVDNRPVPRTTDELDFMAPRQRPLRLLPGLSVEKKEESYVAEDGSRLKRSLPIVRTSSDSVLACSSCYLAGKCPAFDPGSACVYEIPVQIRTKEQLSAVQAALMEMQVKRVLRGGFIEQVEGGYLDPNLSSELDRLNRMIKVKADMDAEGFSLTIRAQQTAGATAANAGVLSRLFGREAAQPVQALPAPVPLQTAAEQMGIVDAEVVADDAA